MSDVLSHEARTTQRPALVIVAPWVYHLRCGIGGGVLCFRIIQGLAEHYDIHWISFDVTSNDVEEGKRALKEFCASVTTITPSQHGPSWALKARQLLGGAPVGAQRMWSPAMAEAVKLGSTRPGVRAVIFQFPYVAQYLGAAEGAPTIMDTQDVAIVSTHREWRKAQGWKKFLAKGSTWLSWVKYEFRHYQQADLLLALSETDAGVLRAFMPDTPCVLSPVATRVRSEPRATTGSYVAMVGNFEHPPNEDGLRWLLADVWPKVRQVIPHARLCVAGPSCPKATPELLAQGVEMLGFVDSLDAFLDEAAVSIAPYRFGGGVKIKVLESLASACPVVATTVGAEGLGVTHGRELIIANGAAEFANALIETLSNPPAAAERAERGRAHVEQHFSFRTKIQSLRAIIDALGPRPRG
ncbi:MAG: glycosyltransferase family 4 protein [Aquabacterium sp.]|uniref:glycosyltransferase family 4 protein n=1 Tax=Aquabacterium sp. TaxID=1872578 RepID=UPI00271BC237|nr:glycosyltransferase family 4 protein [Aquabacterium sp.]MDO9002140.1 glycosyltransferase family 4 protein [Aquabacterium sp.]